MRKGKRKRHLLRFATPGGSSKVGIVSLVGKKGRKGGKAPTRSKDRGGEKSSGKGRYLASAAVQNLSNTAAEEKRVSKKKEER